VSALIGVSIFYLPTLISYRCARPRDCPRIITGALSSLPRNCERSTETLTARCRLGKSVGSTRYGAEYVANTSEYAREGEQKSERKREREREREKSQGESGTRTVVLVNSRKERSVAAALCYLTALPAVILLGLYCRDSAGVG